MQCMLLTCWRQDVLHKHENCLLWADPNPLADNINKLAYCQVPRHQIPTLEAHCGKVKLMRCLHGSLETWCSLFLINVRDLTPFSLLHNNLRCPKRQSSRYGKGKMLHHKRLTGILSGYLSLILWASAWRFSGNKEVLTVFSVFATDLVVTSSIRILT